MASGRRSLEIVGVGKGNAAPAGSWVGDVLYSSSVSGVDPATGALGEGAEKQFELAFRNLRSLVEGAGASTDNIGRITVFIPGQGSRPLINPPWLEMFPDEDNPPAHHAIEPRHRT